MAAISHAMLAALVDDAGFVIERIERRYAKGPKPWSWFTLGVAANPANPR